MRLTVVGCAGSFPSPGVPGSCYLVEAGGFALVLDVGGGALGELAGRVSLDAVGAVLVSHLHPDHCLDLTAWYVQRRYRPHGSVPPPPLPVWAPAGAARRLGAAYAPGGEPADLSDQLAVVDLTAGRHQVGPVTVTAVRVAHPVETYALRVEHDGSALVYSGDTGPCPALADLATGADLLLCEASWPDDPRNPPDLHLSGRQAGEHAAAAGVGRLVLTHLVPWYDPAGIRAEAAGAYTGPVDLARPGASWTV